MVQSQVRFPSCNHLGRELHVYSFLKACKHEQEDHRNVESRT